MQHLKQSGAAFEPTVARIEEHSESLRVAVTLEARFQRTKDGHVWTTQPFHYAFWSRYLDAFDEVAVIARIVEVESASVGSRRADGPGVTFSGLPNYHGVRQFLRSYILLRRAIRQAPAYDDAVILRVPSALAILLASDLRRQRRPYAVEVVGDPADALARRAIGHPLAPLIRWIFVRQLRGECAEAVAAAYVTKHALQDRYPAGKRRGSAVKWLPKRSYSYSDVGLVDDFRAPRNLAPLESPIRSYSYSSVVLADGFRAPRSMAWPPTEMLLITVGSLEHYHKGTDTLISAVAKCCRRGLKLRLEVIGDGRRKPRLATMVDRLGIKENVTFLGHLPAGEPVRDALDRANLFVLPSRTEGLPRAMLEAMARGLPCIGSNVGGIPELLNKEDLAPPADVDRLASLIEAVVTDPTRMAAMAERCFAKAHEYREEVLRPRRKEFLDFVRQKTEEWLATARPSSRQTAI